MNITKAVLATALEQAARFNQLPLARIKNELKVRGQPGFVPVECYGRGMLMLKDEIGTNMRERYLSA